MMSDNYGGKHDFPQRIGMKTVIFQELGSSGFRRVSRWLSGGETVLILKDSLPYARIIPEARQLRTLLGATPGLQPLPPDIDDPVQWSSTKRRSRKRLKSR